MTEPGLVVAKPPYGKRVGEGGELPELYRSLVPEEKGLIQLLGLRCRLLLAQLSPR